MKKLTLIITALCFAGIINAAIWENLPGDPSYWPYGDTNNFSGGDIPSPENNPSACFVYRPSAVQANGKVYVVGGRMSNNGMTPYINAHSHMSIFDPFETDPSNMWQSAKWDGSGPLGINMGSGTDMPVAGNGVSPMGSALGVYDVDFDGTDEIFIFAGENHPGNVVMMYDPDTDSWTNRTGASGMDVMSGAGGQVGSKYYWHGAIDTMAEYNFLNDSWQYYSVPNFPKQTTQGGGASDGSKIYMPWGAYDDLSRASSNNYPLGMYIYDPQNPTSITSGEVPPYGCNQSSVVYYRDRIYVFGGRISGGASSSTNLIQVYITASNKWYVSSDTMPLNVNGQAVWFANRKVFVANGYLFNNSPLPNQTSNVFWSTDIRKLDPPFQPGLDAYPSELDFGMTESTNTFNIGNTGSGALYFTNQVSDAWLSVSPDNGFVVDWAFATNTVIIDRESLVGQPTGYVYITSSAGAETVTVYAAETSAIAVVVPDIVQTFPFTTGLSFRVYNSGTETLYFTNSTSAGWISDITPETGQVAMGGAYETITFSTGAVSPLPATGTVVVAGNSVEAICTVIANPNTFYVSTTGNDNNNGLSPATAWRTITHSLDSSPNGTEQVTVTINIAAGIYENESSLSTTNLWYIKIHNRKYLNIIGAGPEQSFIAKGTNLWPLVFGENNRIPSKCPIDIRNCEKLRFSGFSIIANDPPAAADSNHWDYYCVAIGIENANGVRLDHLYIDGTYTGMLYRTDFDQWVSNWDNWMFHGITLHGLVGTKNAQFDHILIRGFQKSFWNNNFTVSGNDANTNSVLIDHCTFIHNVNAATNAGNGGAEGISAHFPGDYLPTYTVRESIIGDIPWSEWPFAQFAFGLNVDKEFNMAGDDSILPYSNQFWSIGVPAPDGSNYWNPIIDDIVFYNSLYNFTNEPPAFSEIGGLPYSTEIDTAYGVRDVGWNPVPETGLLNTGFLMMMLLLGNNYRLYGDKS